MLKIASGTVPVRKFISKSRSFKAFKLPNEVGMEPTRLLSPRPIASSFDKLPISLGMLPLNLCMIVTGPGALYIRIEL